MVLNVLGDFFIGQTPSPPQHTRIHAYTTTNENHIGLDFTFWFALEKNVTTPPTGRAIT